MDYRYQHLSGVQMTKIQKRIFMERKVVELIIQGYSHNKIARKLKTSKTKVKAIRLKAREFGYVDVENKLPLPSYPSALFNQNDYQENVHLSNAEKIYLGELDYIKGRIEAGWTPITIFEELKNKTSRSSFYRFLRKYKLMAPAVSSKRVIPEIIHRPAEALILDWGLLKTITDSEGKKKKLWFISAILGHSRMMSVRLVWTNSVAETMKAVESILNELGGVPERLTSDNPKCFATVASKYEAILNPQMERFASYYGFTLECLPPYDPEKKGKVEKSVPFVRRLFEAYGDDWRGIEHAQEYMNYKVKIANERIHGTTRARPIDLFINEEKKRLKPMPITNYQREEYAEAKVRQDGHVRFANKYYSLDEKYIDKEVVILGSEDQVAIFLNGALIETHNRIKEAHRYKSTKEVHLREEYRNLSDNQMLIDRAKKIGPKTEEIVKAIVVQGKGFIDTRKIWGILSLDKKYESHRIEDACQFALECGELSYQFILRHLNLKLTPENKHEQIVVTSKRPTYGREISEYKKNYH
jgi:transposase